MSYNPSKWTAFIIYADMEKQIKIVKKLKLTIRKFKHYNYNYYSEWGFPPHVSIRVQGRKYEKQKLEEKIKDLGYEYEVKDYDALVRKAYEFGSRCAFLYDDYKDYFYKDGILDRKTFLFHGLHGLFDDIGIGEKEEGRIHLKLAWHFLVKKPWYKFKLRLRRRSFYKQKFIYKTLANLSELIKSTSTLLRDEIVFRDKEWERLNQKIEQLQKQVDGLKKKR